MTELSPAAQAVLDAMHRSYDHEPTRRLIAAAVLRAAADHLDDHANRLLFGGRYHGMIMAIKLLQSIATQLEGAQPTGSTHLEVGDE